MCGGREYKDADTVSSTVDPLFAVYKDKLIVIQGGALGADRLAKDWCYRRRVACAEVYALWRPLGNSAGPIRNEWMLLLQPDAVIAFPGGSGTASMVRLATQAGVPVRRVGKAT